MRWHRRVIAIVLHSSFSVTDPQITDGCAVSHVIYLECRSRQSRGSMGAARNHVAELIIVLAGQHRLHLHGPTRRKGLGTIYHTGIPQIGIICELYHGPGFKVGGATSATRYGVADR